MDIITNNGRQFTDKKIASFLQNLNIKHHFLSVEHPQTNGLAKAANKIILLALRKKLTLIKGQWAELIPEILWEYNTTPESLTKETPLKLIFGADAMIPVEIAQRLIRTDHFDEEANNQTRNTELDTIEEERQNARIRQEAMQLIVQRKYNKKVKPRPL
ncbi:uncharacterized protein [Arachis hypogaea]|uniref:uncharacterized protein n=1 Tax=Arachis hypogaea TaxID=3818 RepID=UPI003B21B974